MRFFSQAACHFTRTVFGAFRLHQDLHRVSDQPDWKRACSISSDDERRKHATRKP